MSNISFDNVWLLFIAVPIILLVAIPFFIAINKENRNWHNVASSVLHILIAVCIAFSAAGASVETVVTKTEVYVLADVSYSTNKNLDKIDDYIEGLKEGLPRNSKLGIVCFGNDQQVLTKVGDRIRSVRDASVDDSGTNIAGALQFVGRIFHSDSIKKVVVITDGRQSNDIDSGAMKSAVNELYAAGISVDAIYLDCNLKEGIKEAQLSDIEYSSTVYRNREAKATAVINSKYSTFADVYLYKEGEQVAWEHVSLRVGRTTVDFTLPTDAEGEFDYEIRLVADGDENKYNNSGRFTQKVAPVVSVLLITDKRSDATMLTDIFGEDTTVSSYIGVSSIPYTVADLSVYDEIILSNVNLAAKDNYSMFVDSLLSVVSKLGKSLVTMGNLYLSGTDADGDVELDASLKKLAAKLPVDYADSARDNKLVTLVFDASDSMFNLGKLDRAKTAARHIVDGLTDKDSVAMVYFHGDRGTQLSVRALATEEDRQAAYDAIDEVGVKQGTMMSGGLMQAYTEISKLSSYERQVILMSDGLNAAADTNDTLYAWTAMLSNLNIPVSVIDVGRGSGDKWDPLWGAAAERLKEIAAKSGGTYLLADTDKALKEFGLPSITNITKDSIVYDKLDPKPYAVDVLRRFDGVLDGVDANDIPYVMGYVNTGMRASATNVLATEYRMQNGTTMTVPIYSYWRVGNGKISSFTSSISDDDDGNWLSEWKTGEGLTVADKFFGNILKENTPAEKSVNPFAVSISSDTGYCMLELAPIEVKREAEVNVSVTAPDGSITQIKNVVFDSSVYTCSFITPQAGRYKIDVTYTYKGTKYEHSDYYNVLFLPEYDSFALCDAASLYKMLAGRGTVSEDGSLDLSNDAEEVEVRTMHLSMPLLIAAVVLYAADIIIRKLKWEDVVSLFKKVNKEGKK